MEAYDLVRFGAPLDRHLEIFVEVELKLDSDLR